ncbi:SigE family RNA polymerase sigma factor [Nocardioides sp. zg-1308]|uniref:SigE family RNA polymerase sigma factor n=1 Tax=Nocardioides renjunii TaxID=3095075 RepID=A0ABU5KGP8_9ACTN|nr:MULTISPECIES: SigE family RNA polymerase sigma factor [unclassified Nocardioides]MDZ5664123.1 SigE family RNA polymerase sigma factor [Nocardioides sp. S-58]NPD04764.1 SigE family RNA polymerase sigma factor [Nocardioides sp. zg-1308]
MITDDEAGFDAFVTARGAALSRTAYLLTGDHHLAQDLVQAALLQAAKHWRRIHTSPEAYVRRAMYHQNISWWRRRRLVETPLLSHDGAARLADTDLRLTLDEALARLTAKQRTVLVLRFYEDLTEVETARALGITAGTVKSTTRQALSRLRTLAPELAELIGADA